MEVLRPGQRRTSVRRASQEDKSSRTSLDVGSSTNLLNGPDSKAFEIPHKPLSKWKLKIKCILDHWMFSFFMTSLTIYALFGDDIRLSATTKSADSIFYSLTIGCFVLFSIEIILASISIEDYWLGFFFWLDIVSTISLIPDVGWIWDSVVGTSDSIGNSATQATQIARAGRASRAGTRAGRIIRIIRVIRLIRIVKLYKISQNGSKINNTEPNNTLLVRGVQNFRGQQINDEAHIQSRRVLDNDHGESYSYSQSFSSFSDMANNDDNSPSKGFDLLEDVSREYKLPEESKIGKKFSELTTRRVIILVLCMLFILPLFYTTLYLDDSLSYQFGLEVISSLISSEDFDIAWQSYIDEHKDLDTSLIYLEVVGLKKWSEGPDPNDLRDAEMRLYTIKNTTDDYLYSSLAIFDYRSRVKLDAWLNISRTVFVCIVLAFSSVSLTKDAQELVIEPIENMIERLKRIAENPLKAAQEEEKKKISLELAKEAKHEVKMKKNEKDSLETVILEETVRKIGALLALGFGEAGSEIIAMNMQRVGGDVDPLISGKKTYCIFGFCDIRSFTEATEVLQQNIMIFVNEIAYIVHKTVDYYSGFANKNIGDTFLIVWKFSEKLITRNEITKEVELVKDHITRQISDMAVISFIKIIIEIHTNKKILKYRDHIELSTKIPGFSVKMGFGLHQGWAIEGAIGSEFKIDASYLSPNVNMASRLEAATRQFGVQILISEAMHDICTKHTQSQFRKVDRVTVKGSKIPTDLYTCDLEMSVLEAYEEEEDLDSVDTARVANRIARDKLMESINTGKFVVSSIFDSDKHISLARNKVPRGFYKAYAGALKDYIEGRWTEARVGFITAEGLRGAPDGPCATLIQFIDENERKVPDNWPGYRELHDK